MEPVRFGKNQFCGPSVMSAITGLSTDEAATVISSITGRTKVAGVYQSDLIKAFEKLGYKCSRIKLVGRTLFGALMNLTDDGMYVLMVPGHYITIEVNGKQKYICDNRTKEPINVSNSARLGQKVVSVIRVAKNLVANE